MEVHNRNGTAPPAVTRRRGHAQQTEPAMQTHSIPTASTSSTAQRTVRCVSWCAVSSEAQAKEDKESLPDQRARNRAFIEDLGSQYPGCVGELVAELEVVGTRSIILLEEAKQKHPAYAQLVSLLERRAVDAIIVRDTSRLGRELALTAAVQALARRAGCVIIPREGARPTLDGEGNNLYVSAIEGAEAQQYIATLVKRTRVGMVGRVKNAKLFPHKPPFGYKAIYREGERRPVAYIEHPEQGPIVRQVFELYLAGAGMLAIADALNAQGAPTPSAMRYVGKRGIPRNAWTLSMVSELLIRAPVYAGSLIWNRRSTTQQPRIEAEGQHPALLTPEQYEAVQEERSARKTAPRRRLYSGMTFCAVCGKPMRGSYRIIPLQPKIKGGPTRRQDTMLCYDTHVSISEDMLGKALLRAVEELERTPDEALEAALQVRDAGADAARSTASAALTEQLAQLDARRGWLVAQLAAMRLTEDEFDREEKKRRAEVQKAEAELRRVQAAQAKEQDAARRGDRIREVRAAARAVLAKAHAHPDLVRPWLRKHVRLYVSPGYGASRVRVEWV